MVTFWTLRSWLTGQSVAWAHFTKFNEKPAKGRTPANSRNSYKHEYDFYKSEASEARSTALAKWLRQLTPRAQRSLSALMLTGFAKLTMQLSRTLSSQGNTRYRYKSY